MQAFLVSTGLVAISEIGDKTQLLALLLAARFCRPWPIAAGILAATLLNHALAGGLGTLVSQWLSPHVLQWLLAASFLAMAVWMLIPDKVADDAAPQTSRYGIFWTTCVLFFMLEMGDKTQLATVALAARYGDMWWVVLGSTLGMMLANMPVVFWGNRIVQRIPQHWIRYLSALLFAILGLWMVAQLLFP